MKRLILMLALISVIALGAVAGAGAASPNAKNCVGSAVSQANAILKAAGTPGLGDFAHDGGIANLGNAVIDPYSDSVCGTN